MKSRLKKQHKNCQNKDIKIFIEKKIEAVDEIISQDCAEENTRKVNEWLDCLESENGGFSQNGMWKLKSKLCPRPLDPPIAKLDKNGDLVTRPEKLLDLYLETYSNRLSHRKMKKEYEDIFYLKNKLWNLRLEKCSEVKTENWSMKNLRAVLKGLKSNKARDPLGMANEIFKPNVIGEQLEFALLSLMNGTKSESFIPTIMRLADISSIWKRKASKKDLENDQGIFSHIRLRGILDKLIFIMIYIQI